MLIPTFFWDLTKFKRHKTQTLAWYVVTLAVANFDIDSTVRAGTAPNTRGQIECSMAGMSEYVSDKISDRMFLKMPEYMFQVRGPPPSPPPWSWFPLPPCGCGCCRYCMVAPPPLWMWVPPVDVSPVRSVWFAPLPLWMWVLFAPYTK